MNQKFRSKNDAISTNHFGRYWILIAIFLVHVVIILNSKNTQSSLKQTINTNKTLLLLSLPLQKINTDIIKQSTLQKTIQVTVQATIQSNKFKSRLPSTKHQSEREFINTESITVTNQTPTPNSQVQASPLVIEKNIRDLSQTLKEDFLKQEKNFRPDNKSQSESMKKFSNALADAAQIQREGVIIEKKFAYDGRPVSKVKTPYGTYCVRHPKAGEKLELSPPPLPVTCGQL